MIQFTLGGVCEGGEYALRGVKSPKAQLGHTTSLTLLLPAYRRREP